MKRGEEHNEERDEEMKDTRQKFYPMQEREMKTMKARGETLFPS